MTLPRSILVDPDTTPFYHCVSRCVRRAFLCGQDSVTGYNFEHRRAWIENRMLELAGIFAIDVCAYAVMSNHYHVVLRINADQQRGWDDAAVMERWQRIHKLPDGFDGWDRAKILKTLTEWRERLASISWFMKCLNEPLARMANREDQCKGRFWEGRFRSQALLDEAAVLKCMAYVDLNPIRAGVAATPEESAYTSVKARIERRDGALAPLGNRRNRDFALPISKTDYLQLVDWTGRQLRPGKRGRIRELEPPIVERLRRSSYRSWRDEMRHLTRRYFRAIGNPASLTTYRDSLGQKRLKGLTA